MFARLRKMISDEISAGTQFDSAMIRVGHEIKNNMPLTDEVIAEALEIASRSVGRMAIRDSRAAVCRRADSAREGSAKKTEALKEKVAGLLDFRLPGGKPIKDATGSECIEAAVFYHKIAETNRIRGRFLMLVGKKAGDKLVSEVIDEKRCKKLYKEARNERQQISARAA